MWPWQVHWLIPPPCRCCMDEPMQPVGDEAADGIAVHNGRCVCCTQLNCSGCRDGPTCARSWTWRAKWPSCAPQTSSTTPRSGTSATSTSRGAVPTTLQRCEIARQSAVFEALFTVLAMLSRASWTPHCLSPLFMPTRQTMTCGLLQQLGCCVSWLGLLLQLVQTWAAVDAATILMQLQ